MPSLTGRVIAGRYNLQSPIGRGAMGMVWRAHDRLLDREVAVKEVVISSLIGEDERRNAYQRTLREARTAARLSHRGVVAIYDVVEEDSRPWIIMELVPSQSLDQVLVVEGRLPPGRVGRIGQQLLSALAAAHLAGVLHRDVKPSNVLIANNKTGEGWDERAVLTDFGIAQFEGDPRLTQTGMVMGSPGFTAPERIRGSDATPASDLWSLGATIYAAVEGRGPYENRGGAITTMSAIINEDAPVAPHAEALAPVIAALLRRSPAARPSASLAARMFAQALLQMPDSNAEPPATAHPPTIRSTFLPQPAAPAASASVTAPDSARAKGKPAPAAKEEPAKDIPATQATAAEEPVQQAPPAEEGAEEAAGAVSAEAGRAAAADPATAEPGPEPEAEAKPEAVAEPEAEPEAEAKPEPGAKPEPEAEAETEVKPAAETAKFTASPPKSAASAVPEPPPAEAPAAEQKAAAAALLAPGSDDLVPGSDDEESGSRAADTVIPRKDAAAEHQSPAAPAPAARVAPPSAAPAQPKPPARPKPSVPPKSDPPRPESPKPEPPNSEPPVPEPPKPTFTAAKPTERPVPTFSAANPARAATTGRPTPPRLTSSGTPASPSSSQRPPYGQGGASHGYSPPGKGSTAPFPPPPFRGQGGQSGQGAQYAGPSQPSPDLSRQYPPGSGGGAGKRGRQGLGRKTAWAVAAVIVAAAVGVGAALALSHGNGPAGAANEGNTTSPTAVPWVEDTPTGFKSINALNNPSTTLPGPGWTTQTVTRANAGSAAAGFSIDVPPGWKKTSKGLTTDFSGPDGLLLEVDLTQQSTSDMLTAAGQVESASKSRFPGYKRLNLQAEPVRHTEGAVWKFRWTPAGGTRQTVDDIFFAQSTPSGVQDYAIYIRSPSAVFGSKALPLFDMMLRTFQTVPAS